MCNIAGYVGNELAAPRLIEMMRREEGYAGGYYTGIATMCEGKIYTAKVVGGLDKLLRETDAARLPGTIGLLHSRSKSGGDVEWGHPFISTAGSPNGETRLAIIVNGYQGPMVEKPLQDSVARSLDADGVIWRAREPKALGRYPCLDDGSCVHFSEALCHLVSRYAASGLTPARALAAAHDELPAEIVTLALHLDAPGRILVARRNMPLMIGRAQGATYLASTAIAFPGDVDFIGIEPAPACSFGEVGAGSASFSSLSPGAYPVAQIDSGMFAAARAALLEALNEAGGEPKRLTELLQSPTASLWPEGKLSQSMMLMYETLRPLLNDGTVSVSTRAVPGAFEGIDAPAFFLTPGNESRIR